MCVLYCTVLYCHVLYLQTSAASVVIMPEPTEVEVDIRAQDLKIDLYRSQGAGGE